MNIVTTNEYGPMATDTINKFLSDQNAVLITGEINSDTSMRAITDLAYLSQKDPKAPIKIVIIESPGGSVTSALSILSFANMIPNPIITIGMGLVASAASWLLTCIDAKERLVLDQTQLMYHQPLINHLSGQASDVQITAEQIVRTKKLLNSYLSNKSKLSFKEIESNFDRDCWLEVDEAIKMGLVDRQLTWGDFRKEN